MALTSKETNDIIKNKSLRAASKRRTATKIIIVVLLISLLISGGTYGVLTLIQANSMMIMLDQKEEGLSLCEYKEFKKPSTSLKMGGPEELGGHTYSWFSSANILGKEGNHPGANYVAYSFYLKNVSTTKPCLYTTAIELTKNTLNVDAALRVLVIEYEQIRQDDVTKDYEAKIDTVKVYAKSKSDGRAEYISYDSDKENQKGVLLEDLQMNMDILDTNLTIPFFGIEEKSGLYYAMRQTGNQLGYNSIKKYTVVLWLEGTDLQCTNDILGGKCSINIRFTLEKMLDPENY